MLKKYVYEGDGAFSLKEFPCDSKMDKANKLEVESLLAENQIKMEQLQDKLYADGKEGIVIILQAMDAAGKDSTIRHALGPLNPQGVDVYSFKQPNADELSHDYLFRAHRAIPQRGKIAIFNRSYYEDVLVVQVHNLQENYKVANRCKMDSKLFFKQRYREIYNFEQYLYDNSYRVIKIFLHVSKKEQKKRFLKRIDDVQKNWKFSSSDLKEREYYETYMKVYEEVIKHTASKESPWYIVPADQKWYTRYIVSEIIVSQLQLCDPQYPSLNQAEQDSLQTCKQILEKEE